MKKLISLSTITWLLLQCRSTTGDSWMPRELGRFRVAHAGFVEVFDKADGGKDLYITTFNAALPFFHDPVFFLSNPGEQLDSVSSWGSSLQTLGTKASAYWPNFPVQVRLHCTRHFRAMIDRSVALTGYSLSVTAATLQVPESVLGYEAVVQTSGFLVPGKSEGKIELYDTSAGQQGQRGPINIASEGGDGHNWSYHWVVWRDVDNDGLLDALTARFRVPAFGGDPISQLVWYKNPGTATPAPGQDWPWQHFILVDSTHPNTLHTGGPDVYFEEQVFSVDGVEYSALLTGELWTERIVIYYVENTPGAWAQPRNIKSIVVDEAPGQPFEAHWADLNNDGVLEILASCYDTRKGNETGNLWVYQQQGETWTRSALATGFTANSYLFGNSMTPGKSRLFWPSEEYKATPTEFGPVPKPWLALSGDDDGVHYILFPKSEDPANMEYDMQVNVNTHYLTARGIYTVLFYR